jgi:hypothetical protein
VLRLGAGRAKCLSILRLCPVLDWPGPPAPGGLDPGIRSSQNRRPGRSGGMVDAADSKSAGGYPVRVRVPPPAPSTEQVAASSRFSHLPPSRPPLCSESLLRHQFQWWRGLPARAGPIASGVAVAQLARCPLHHGERWWRGLPARAWQIASEVRAPQRAQRRCCRGRSSGTRVAEPVIAERGSTGR